MSNIIYKNKKLYNPETQSYLVYINTHQKLIDGILVSVFVYQDNTNFKKFFYTHRDLEFIERLSDSDLRVY